MYIKIKLKEKDTSGTTIRYVNFPIDLDALEAATLSTYLEPGTQYAPIRADNYISLGNNQFPSILSNTKLVVSLTTKEGEDCEDDDKNIPENGRLVCCKIKNVGKAFNNSKLQILNNNWANIFEVDSENLIEAPDGTLYIATNKKGECTIQTQKEVHDSYLSYSILFSLIFEERNYYFILDPVVSIRSDGSN
jgi:hypothetical protein